MSNCKNRLKLYNVRDTALRYTIIIVVLYVIIIIVIIFIRIIYAKRSRRFTTIIGVRNYYNNSFVIPYIISFWVERGWGMWKYESRNDDTTLQSQSR